MDEERTEENARPTVVGGYPLAPDALQHEVLDWVIGHLHRRCSYERAVQIAREIAAQLKASALECDASENASLDATTLYAEAMGRLRPMELESEGTVPCDVSFVTSVFAIKNKRCRMEDRHVVHHDLNLLLDLKDAPPHRYYAVFDGHAGISAASYASAHLHVNISRHPDFLTDPLVAIREGYRLTDQQILELAAKHDIKSGCTAVSALVRGERTVYLSWLGDSQAVLVRQDGVLAPVHVHKPDREDERKRIEALGGWVSAYYGTWRVNGNLAVSRALGDPDHKPYISSEPETVVLELDGSEDFLVLGCDGLWDCLTPEDARDALYAQLAASPAPDALAAHLAQLARRRGSDDNISVVVVLLREPGRIAEEGAGALPAPEATPLSELPTPPIDEVEALLDSSAPLGKYQLNPYAEPFVMPIPDDAPVLRPTDEKAPTPEAAPADVREDSTPPPDIPQAARTPEGDAPISPPPAVIATENDGGRSTSAPDDRSAPTEASPISADDVLGPPPEPTEASPASANDGGGRPKSTEEDLLEFSTGEAPPPPVDLLDASIAVREDSTRPAESGECRPPAAPLVDLLTGDPANGQGEKPVSAAPDLYALPDGLPEAEGVTEDVDSDSEKDGGWSYVKGNTVAPKDAKKTPAAAQRAKPAAEPKPRATADPKGRPAADRKSVLPKADARAKKPAAPPAPRTVPRVADRGRKLPEKGKPPSAVPAPRPPTATRREPAPVARTTTAAPTRTAATSTRTTAPTRMATAATRTTAAAPKAAETRPRVPAATPRNVASVRAVAPARTGVSEPKPRAAARRPAAPVVKETKESVNRQLSSRRPASAPRARTIQKPSGPPRAQQPPAKPAEKKSEEKSSPTEDGAPAAEKFILEASEKEKGAEPLA